MIGSGSTRGAGICIVALLCQACASASAVPAQDEVDALLSARIGHRVSWLRGGEPDRAVERLVAATLQRPLTPDDAVTIALVRNAQLRATFEDLGIAQADLVQAGLLQNLHVGGGPRFLLGGGPVGWSGDVAVVFLDAFLIPARKKIAEANRRAAVLRVAHEVLALDAEVRNAYYKLVAARQSAAMQAEISDATMLAAELGERQRIAGTMNELDHAQLVANAQRAQLELVHLRAELVEHRERLNALMGVWGPTAADWETQERLPKLPLEEPSLHALERVAILQRFDLAATRAEAAAAAKSIALARGTRATRADVGLLGEQDPGDGATLGPFIELEIPIFDWGQGEIPRLEAMMRQLEWRAREQSIHARAEVRSLRNRMIAERMMTDYQRDVVLPQQRNIVALAQRRYDAMLLGVYELLALKREEIEARRAFVAHLRDYWIARTELERSVGGRLEASIARWQQPPSTPAEGGAAKKGTRNGDS